MPSRYKYYRLFMRMLDGEDVEGEFSWYLDMDGEGGVEAFREILFGSIEKNRQRTTDRVSTAKLKRINEIVSEKIRLIETAP